MLTLYYKPNCAYCQRVLGEVEALGIQLDLKDLSADPLLREEMIAKGGKSQVPYLVDADRGMAMYESGDIIAYLTEQYAQQSTGGLRVHKSEAACDVCE